MATSQSSPIPESLVENEVSQECKDLMFSLPKERGWACDNLYQYQGFWHESTLLQGVLACQKHFQAHNTDILLVTFPKSGTTWLNAILFALLNRKRYPDTQQHPLRTHNPHELVPFLELMCNLNTSNQLPVLTSLSSPRLFSTHIPLVSMPKSVDASACKIVYLCRNPRDTFVSYWHFTKRVRSQKQGTTNDLSLEESFDMFCKGQSPFGPFWDHVVSYWKESLEKPEKILFLKYEEMKEQPNVHLRRLAEFLDCPFSPEEETEGVVDQIIRLCSFGNLSNLEVNKSGKLSFGLKTNVFFRRGEVGDGKNYLTAEMIDRLDLIIQEKLHGSGLKF